MAIIKLTEACYVREKGLKRILGFYNKKSFFETTGAYFREAYAEDINGKRIRCAIFNNRYVKETPEEILELIKEAEKWEKEWICFILFRFIFGKGAFSQIIKQKILFCICLKYINAGVLSAL